MTPADLDKIVYVAVLIIGVLGALKLAALLFGGGETSPYSRWLAYSEAKHARETEAEMERYRIDKGLRLEPHPWDQAFARMHRPNGPTEEPPNEKK